MTKKQENFIMKRKAVHLMREILFRGKSKNNGKWYQGDLVTVAHKRFIDDDVVKERVIPETVGQYTGLTDKNGKKIFEGDIVVVYARGYHTVCTVSWAETVAHFQLWQINTVPKTSTNLNLGNYDFEVIGNIHDNPELLKGGASDA
ncbi:MAG: hypothetical protein E7264_12150 [Lachnospiraceae bacterium]|nr:hypothetical protein [Lachnospiraceae bacterium]